MALIETLSTTLWRLRHTPPGAGLPTDQVPIPDQPLPVMNQGSPGVSVVPLHDEAGVFHPLIHGDEFTIDLLSSDPKLNFTRSDHQKMNLVYQNADDFVFDEQYKVVRMSLKYDHHGNPVPHVSVHIAFVYEGKNAFGKGVLGVFKLADNLKDLSSADIVQGNFPMLLMHGGAWHADDVGTIA